MKRSPAPSSLDKEIALLQDKGMTISTLGPWRLEPPLALRSDYAEDRKLHNAERLQTNLQQFEKRTLD